MTAPSGADRADVRTVVGVLREPDPAERRVALTPDAVPRLTALGLDVVVAAGAGASAWFPDDAYAEAGAEITDADAVVARCDVLVCIGAPGVTLRAGQVLIGLLDPLADHDLVAALASARVTAISLDGLPRTLSSAQSMDALTSQSNVAGYKAALVAAETYGGYFPMLMTAAGTVRPAKVLVIGAGVAGLQAIGTARRLGAVVTGYDVRDAARADVASTGAAFLDLGAAGRPTTAGDADGGYARELTADERTAQQDALVHAVATFDIVITTAQVPGRRPPVLVSAAAVAAMATGSVIVDLGSGPLGGNVVGSVPDTATVTDNGVTVIGAGALPSTVPRAASTAYARNIASLLAHLVADGRIHLDRADAITAATLVTDAGAVVRPDLQPQHSEQTAGDRATAAAGSPR